MMKEIWKDVPGLEGLYEVCPDGRVRNAATKRELKPLPIGKGYRCIKYHGKAYYIHRCVALAFVPNPNAQSTVNHLNGNKEDNRAENLEWVSMRDNLMHARRTGLHKKDSDKPVLQLLNGEVIARYKSAAEAARQTGISNTHIGNAIHHRQKEGRSAQTTAGGFEWKFEKEDMDK
jgi:hypothetical protein